MHDNERASILFFVIFTFSELCISGVRRNVAMDDICGGILLGFNCRYPLFGGAFIMVGKEGEVDTYRVERLLKSFFYLICCDLISRQVLNFIICVDRSHGLAFALMPPSISKWCSVVVPIPLSHAASRVSR